MTTYTRTSKDGFLSEETRQEASSRALAQTLIPQTLIPLNIHLVLPSSVQFYFSLTKAIPFLQSRFRRWQQKPYPRVVVRRAKLLELTLPIKRQSLFLFYSLSEVSEGADRFRRLYCTNLPDKLRKYDLRLSLYTLFSTYGTVLDVVAMKTEKMRGQAHIVFKDIQTSTQAMRALQGFDFFGKEMVCGLPFISQKGL